MSVCGRLIDDEGLLVYEHTHTIELFPADQENKQISDLLARLKYSSHSERLTKAVVIINAQEDDVCMHNFCKM